MMNEIINAANNNKLVLFVGSGLSIDLGFPSWEKIVFRAIKQVNTEEEYEAYLKLYNSNTFDLLEILSKHEKYRPAITKLLKNAYAKDLESEELDFHKKLIRVSTKVVTTNYDYALETAIGVKPICYNDKFEIADLPNKDKYVFKIHGTASSIKDCIFFPSDYKRFYKNGGTALAEFTNIARNNILLFLGYSIGDPHIYQILNHLSDLYSKFLDKHYIFTTSDENYDDYNINKIKMKSYDELEQKINEILEGKKSLKVPTFDFVEKKPSNRFLRRRCRLFLNNSSEEFLKLTNYLVSGVFDDEFDEDLTKKIREIPNQYEKNILYGLYYEKKGAIEKTLHYLDQVKFKDDIENTRLLLKAIGLEKLDKTKEAKELNQQILSTAKDVRLLRAAQFNLHVCYEKENDPRSDFELFFEDKTVMSDNERIADKAISMELVNCYKQNKDFFYIDLLQESLKYLKENSPMGFVKTYLNAGLLDKKIQFDINYEKIINLVEDANINKKVATYYQLAKYLKNLESSPKVIEDIIGKIEEISKNTDSKSISKYLKATKALSNAS